MDKISKQNEPESKLELSSQGYVTLPFNRDDFKEFVVGLLGKPQTIDGEIKGAFEIEVSDIRNLYDLIEQRVVQQNDATLIQFNARIQYSDKTSVLINSIEELLSYNVIKPIVSESIHLTFQYLIKFQDKKVPEKQEINISFVGSKNKKERTRSSSIVYDDILLRRAAFSLLKEDTGGFIQFNIKHTARTWGTDLESLLSNHFKSILLPETSFRSFLRDHSESISAFLLFLIFGLGIFFTMQVNNKWAAKRKIEIEALFENVPATMENVSNQIEYLTDHSVHESSSIYLIGGLLSFIVGFITFLVATTQINQPKNSYVLLSKKSFNKKEIQDKQYNRQFLNFIFTIVISIGCSLIANFLFYHFS